MNIDLDVNSDAGCNRTHSKELKSFDECIQRLKQRIVSRGDLTYATCDRQLEIVNEFSAFPLGRYILERRGANGFWTDYMVSHPERGKISGLNSEGRPFSPMENFFLNQCPIVIAHQERFQIFKKLTQNLIKEGVVLASIPCGLMRDLITLDFSHLTEFKLIGMDIDPESLRLAEQLSRESGISNSILLQQNAWETPFINEIDVINSSGLNVYEPDPKKVLDLYGKFYRALKPGGHLIISVLTCPPGESTNSDWDTRGISDETLELDKILHKDILEVKWRNFRSAPDLEKEFKQVGFTEISVHFDKHRIFPTILAKKPITKN